MQTDMWGLPGKPRHPGPPGKFARVSWHATPTNVYPVTVGQKIRARVAYVYRLSRILRRRGFTGMD